MKTFLALMLTLISTIALAAELVPLATPPPASARWTCAGTGFNLDGTAKGICELKVHTSMRYAQDARYQYLVSWGADGALLTPVTYPTTSTFCYSPAHLGSDKSGCFAMVHYSDTNNVILIDGYPWWLAGVSTNGVELVNNQTDAFLATP